jgi:hypothetical protein
MRFDPQPTDPSLEQRLTALVDELSTRIRRLKSPSNNP